MTTHVSRKSVDCTKEAAVLAALLRLMIDRLDGMTDSKDMRSITEDMIATITAGVRNIHKKEEGK